MDSIFSLMLCDESGYDLEYNFFLQRGRPWVPTAPRLIPHKFAYYGNVCDFSFE